LRGVFGFYTPSLLSFFGRYRAILPSDSSNRSLSSSQPSILAVSINRSTCDPFVVMADGLPPLIHPSKRYRLFFDETGNSDLHAATKDPMKRLSKPKAAASNARQGLHESGSRIEAPSRFGSLRVSRMFMRGRPRQQGWRMYGFERLGRQAGSCNGPVPRQAGPGVRNSTFHFARSPMTPDMLRMPLRRASTVSAASKSLARVSGRAEISARLARDGTRA
jgi:hypothetical protein